MTRLPKLASCESKTCLLYTSITFDIKKIYEEGYSTKGENRGLGLNNVRKILANYGTMFLETELQENRFLQVLKIGGYEQE